MPRRLPTKHVHIDWFWLGREPWRPHVEEVKSARLREAREALRIEEINEDLNQEDLMSRMSRTKMPSIGQPFQVIPFTWVRSIEEFDGPILSEYQDIYGTPYLEKWCDFEDGVVRSLWVVSSHRAIEEYLAGRLTMLGLLTLPNRNVGFLIDRNRNQEVVHSTLVDIRTIPPNYMPEPDMMYDADLAPRPRL